MSSDFWLNRLREAGTAPAPAPAAPKAGFTATGTPWWAHPTYGPPQAAQPQQSLQPQPPQGVYVTTKAQSAKATERCPSCGSDEYWRATPNTQALCNQCHYPVQNSTQGMAISNQDGPKRASLRQAKGAGYRPDIIVGRV